jgi:hypothetical protein
MFRQFQYYKLSRQEYKQARGTAHKQLLVETRQKAQSLYQENLNYHRNAEQELKHLQEAQKQELEAILVQHLLESRLNEIKGIGPQRKAAIIQDVFRGKLSDLQQASKIPGITTTIQVEINRWVAHYQQELPHLLEQDFSGKSTIEARFKPRIALQEQILHDTEAKNSSLQARIRRIDEELKWLNKITVRTFLQALIRPEQSAPELDRYLCGVFAEWEPVPEWFQEIVSFSSMPVTTLQPATSKPTSVTPASRKTGELIHGDSRPSQPTNTLRKGFELLIIIGALSGVCFVCFFLMIMMVSRADSKATPTTVLRVSPTVIATNTRRSSATPPPTATQSFATATFPPTATPTTIPTTTPTSTLTPSATAVLLPQVRVLIGAANLRAGPNQDESVVGIARADEVLVVIDMNEEGTWLLVQTIDGLEGWIGSTVVEPIDNDTN